MNQEKKKYIVTQPNTRDWVKGDIVDLTGKQAKSLVNKVRLHAPIKDEGKAARDEALSAELAAARRTIEDLRAEAKTFGELQTEAASMQDASDKKLATAEAEIKKLKADLVKASKPAKTGA